MARFRALKAARGDSVREAAGLLERGGILAHPTSTVYGLGARPLPELDLEIGRLKGRPATDSLIRVAADAETVRARLGPAWSERHAKLAAAFWPGSLTLVADDGTPRGFAVRVDAHPVLRSLLREAGGLMSSTSLNVHGEPPARDGAGARRALRGLPETERELWLLDAGELGDSPPSTIVSLRGVRPRLLRAGAVPAERVEECLGEELER